MRDGNPNDQTTETNVDNRVVEIVAAVEANVPCNLVHAREKEKISEF